MRGDLIRILHKLLKRKHPFDAILIETTGLADPAPVAQTFFVDDDLKVWCGRLLLLLLLPADWLASGRQAVAGCGRLWQAVAGCGSWQVLLTAGYRRCVPDGALQRRLN